MPDVQINRSSRQALCIIVLHDDIEKGMGYLFPLPTTLARLTEVRDALKLKESFETSLACDCISPVKDFASRKQNSI